MAHLRAKDLGAGPPGQVLPGQAEHAQERRVVPHDEPGLVDHQKPVGDVAHDGRKRVQGVLQPAGGLAHAGLQLGHVALYLPGHAAHGLGQGADLVAGAHLAGGRKIVPGHALGIGRELAQGPGDAPDEEEGQEDEGQKHAERQHLLAQDGLADGLADGRLVQADVHIAALAPQDGLGHVDDLHVRGQGQGAGLVPGAEVGLARSLTHDGQDLLGHHRGEGVGHHLAAGVDHEDVRQAAHFLVQVDGRLNGPGVLAQQGLGVAVGDGAGQGHSPALVLAHHGVVELPAGEDRRGHGHDAEGRDHEHQQAQEQPLEPHGWPPGSARTFWKPPPR